MLEATLRELEEHLSEYVRKAAEGEDVRVSVDGRVVAIGRRPDLAGPRRPQV